jgi:hypothetical protein
MTDQITISKTLSICECGKDEHWLQDQTAANPSILGLGELEVVSREKQQSSGGRLDLLLGDSENGLMYEVELMLGATDESHIIRTLEYWDLERRRWPKRTHTAVLVAETMNRRFFNVIQLLSLTIPIIAIQTNIIEVAGNRVLHFTKILDAYQELELEERPQIETIETVGEDFWQQKSAGTLANAKALQEILSRGVGELTLRYKASYIRLLHDEEIYFSLAKGRNGKTTFYAWLKNSEIPKTTGVLDGTRIPYDLKPWNSDWQTVRLTVDQNLIQGKKEVFEKIAELTKESWQSELN